jgi:hypothetical protein
MEFIVHGDRYVLIHGKGYPIDILYNSCHNVFNHYIPPTTAVVSTKLLQML